MRMILVGAVLMASCFCVVAQEGGGALSERRVALSEKAVAFDGSGAPALEATLRTTALNGADDSPVTNIRMVVRNAGSVPYTFVSGLVTFYDGCGRTLRRRTIQSRCARRRRILRDRRAGNSHPVCAGNLANSCKQSDTQSLVQIRRPSPRSVDRV